MPQAREPEQVQNVAVGAASHQEEQIEEFTCDKCGEKFTDLGSFSHHLDYHEIMPEYQNRIRSAVNFSGVRYDRDSRGGARNDGANAR